MIRPGEKLLIVGASVRAAAMSAIRSGIACSAVDRFGDADLQEIATAIRIEDYPAGLIAAAKSAPPGPWMYTGAIENHPDLIDALSRMRKLFGIGGESLRRVRDPFLLSAALAAAGVKALRCVASSDSLPHDGTWLRKPTNSGGGCGICVWDERMAGAVAMLPPHPQPVRRGSRQALSCEGRGENWLFQRRVVGDPVGAVYVGSGRGAALLGVTRQLIGADWCGLPMRSSNRFRYCGSVGPISLTPKLAEKFQRIGDVLVQAFDLVGLFGVDAIVADGDVWPVEVNPRYTASVEVLERVLGIRSIALHVAACEQAEIAVAPPFDSRECCGKAILFADRGRIISPEFFAWCRRQNQGHDWPAVADIPSQGTHIAAGQPIVTVFAEGADEAEALKSLRSLAAAALGEFVKCAKIDQKSHAISPNLFQQ